MTMTTTPLDARPHETPEHAAAFRPKPTYGPEDVSRLFSCSTLVAELLLVEGPIPSGGRLSVAHDDLAAWLRSEPGLAPVLARLEWAERLAALARTAAV